jgi:Bestrophin, RFP-TM, chloride channel
MMRIQACVALALLLAAESESFSTTGTARITSSSSIQQQRLQQHESTSASSRKRQLRPSVAAFLYSSEFDGAHESYGGLDKVNNRHSAGDYWYNIRTLPSSCILRDIGNPVLAVFGWSTVVSLAHSLMAKSGRSVLQSMASKLCVSSAAHSFLVSAIGLLLVFRTNSAYQRFNVSILPL